MHVSPSNMEEENTQGDSEKYQAGKEQWSACSLAAPMSHFDPVSETLGEEGLVAGHGTET